MVNKIYSSLNYFFERYKNNFSIQIISASFSTLLSNESTDPQDIIALYNDAIALIEQRLWSADINEGDLNRYHDLFLELEQLIVISDCDDRHRFIIVIPVADRPHHLNSCLQSLLKLCKCFNYGGFKDNQFSKISVLIADDSKYQESIDANKKMAEQLSRQGLAVEYFGQQEQKNILNQFKGNIKDISNIIGGIDENDFYHKGASATRNIAYLKINELSKEATDPLLFYFIDSDQEFQVNVQSKGKQKNYYAVNYFYYLDQIFSRTDARVLTGKVVGDPPVSPSVMACNFLDDLICFVTRMSELEMDQACQFHGDNEQKNDDACYHDMADLFGFPSSKGPYQYDCILQGKHNHAQCFNDLSAKLNKFFDGEHPTRKSVYSHEDVLANVKSARTVYTGNYVFKPECLKYFIPFASLKLRMAGPVLGRLIKADIASDFVSANLPMLHNRTVEAIGKSEFRAGICRNQNAIDLSIEFERQFFGDVMLFATEQLIELGYPNKTLSENNISEVVWTTIKNMNNKYAAKHKEIISRINVLKSLLNDSRHGWNKNKNLQEAKQNFNYFIQNIEYNFGVKAAGCKFITSNNEIEIYHKRILNALMSYIDDMSNWKIRLGTRK